MRIESWSAAEIERTALSSFKNKSLSPDIFLTIVVCLDPASLLSSNYVRAKNVFKMSHEFILLRKQ